MERQAGHRRSFELTSFRLNFAESWMAASYGFELVGEVQG